eukprot:9493412-Pyramimonas_sp.AAC.1
MDEGRVPEQKGSPGIFDYHEHLPLLCPLHKPLHTLGAHVCFLHVLPRSVSSKVGALPLHVSGTYEIQPRRTLGRKPCQPTWGHCCEHQPRPHKPVESRHVLLGIQSHPVENGTHEPPSPTCFAELALPREKLYEMKRTLNGPLAAQTLDQIAPEREKVAPVNGIRQQARAE